MCARRLWARCRCASSLLRGLYTSLPGRFMYGEPFRPFAWHKGVKGKACEGCCRVVGGLPKRGAGSRAECTTVPPWRLLSVDAQATAQVAIVWKLTRPQRFLALTLTRSSSAALLRPPPVLLISTSLLQLPARSIGQNPQRRGSGTRLVAGQRLAGCNRASAQRAAQARGSGGP